MEARKANRKLKSEPQAKPILKRNWLLKSLRAACGFFLLITSLACAQDYTDNQIADAIFKAEGGSKAKSPFGILSVKCEGYNGCRRICLNTIRNNRKRFADYGYKEYPDFLSFLQSRYAPTKNATNDPKGLNRNWLKNVRYFLKKLTEQKEE